eukprot:gb/GEZN01009025.1/.p1 GENE.gb/GEZN01009025.1/~~gb/GEZN01009025.1/.p1  ORF type:complete len:288 (+),score=23.90 gb/GEZN01009025.1/:83-865(+)
MSGLDYRALGDIDASPWLGSSARFLIRAAGLGVAALGSLYLFQGTTKGNTTNGISNKAFWPPEGVEAVTIRPSLLPSAFSILSPKTDQPSCSCFFIQTPQERIQAAKLQAKGEVSPLQEAWMYGAKVEISNGYAVISGAPVDVVKGSVICYTESSRDSSSLPIPLDATATKKSQLSLCKVAVVLKDGSVVQALAYLHTTDKQGQEIKDVPDAALQQLQVGALSAIKLPPSTTEEIDLKTSTARNVTDCQKECEVAVFGMG